MAVMRVLAVLTLLCASAAISNGVTIDELDSQVQELQTTLNTVSRQLMMQQLYVEEMARSEGNSGIKQIRTNKVGSRSYYSASHTAQSVSNVHNHADHQLTAGLGEFIAVLNGVEFRTRHNDYPMKRKADSPEYGATVDIAPPEVPLTVSSQSTVQDQVNEMKEYFRAFAEQNDTIRDYKPYFKPVLCYLEGAWTFADLNGLSEPFESDRHQLDATSWLDLQDKIRFTSYSGGQDSQENFAFLPTSLYTFNGTKPVLAQWNYRILCHPLTRDLPVNRFQPVDHLKSRISLSDGMDFDKYLKSRAARFQLSVLDYDSVRDQAVDYALLDELMEEIPGANNYGANLTDDAFGEVALEHDSSTALNAAYYHRSFTVEKVGAMGTKGRKRGYSDDALFVALTTQPEVAGLDVERCNKFGKNCESWSQRWTYATPLEIIYLTPLDNWNPYNIEYRGAHNSDLGQTVEQGPGGAQRTGENTLDKAYNGTHSKLWYRTPVEFFSGEVDADAADTAKDSTFVIDRNGTVRHVSSSGLRIILPEIPGVGTIRQRYPIMSLYEDGMDVTKNLAALEDMVQDMNKHVHLFRGKIPQTAPLNETVVEQYIPKGGFLFILTAWQADHMHTLTLTETQSRDFLAGVKVDGVTSSPGPDGHTHTVDVRLRDSVNYAHKCDGELRCPAHQHHRILVRVN